MNEIDLIKSLARSSADTGIPESDLSAAVLSNLSQRPPEDDSRIWQYSAAGGCIVATLACVLAMQSWSSLFNPLSDLSSSQTTTVEVP